jgi:hypothetical protein
MDSDEIRATFADRGVIRLEPAFSTETAARIQASVWSSANTSDTPRQMLRKAVDAADD